MEGILVSQGVNQRRLLPVAQELRVDAQIFLYELIRFRKKVVFQLQIANVMPESLDLLLQIVGAD